jgi:hypothetical protein
MIERRADWKHAEQSDARFFLTISPSAIGERRAGCPPLHPSTIAPSSGRTPRGRGSSPKPDRTKSHGEPAHLGHCQPRQQRDAQALRPCRRNVGGLLCGNRCREGRPKSSVSLSCRSEGPDTLGPTHILEAAAAAKNRLLKSGAVPGPLSAYVPMHRAHHCDPRHHRVVPA